jgi:hypothetical protein
MAQMTASQSIRSVPQAEYLVQKRELRGGHAEVASYARSHVVYGNVELTMH